MPAAFSTSTHSALLRVRTGDGDVQYQWGLVNFRGPALLADLKSRPYPSYAFFDLLMSEEQLLAAQKPKVDPAVFKDTIVFVGVQPVLMQVPPKRLRSTIATFWPEPASRSARAGPAWPVPMMIAS